MSVLTRVPLPFVVLLLQVILILHTRLLLYSGSPVIPLLTYAQKVTYYQKVILLKKCLFQYNPRFVYIQVSYLHDLVSIPYSCSLSKQTNLNLLLTVFTLKIVLISHIFLSANRYIQNGSLSDYSIPSKIPTSYSHFSSFTNYQIITAYHVTPSSRTKEEEYRLQISFSHFFCRLTIIILHVSCN